MEGPLQDVASHLAQALDADDEDPLDRQRDEPVDEPRHAPNDQNDGLPLLEQVHCQLHQRQSDGQNQQQRSPEIGPPLQRQEGKCMLILSEGDQTTDT